MKKENLFNYCSVCGVKLEEPNGDGICLECILPKESDMYRWIIKIWTEDGQFTVCHSFDSEPDLAVHDNFLCYSCDSEYVNIPILVPSILKKELKMKKKFNKNSLFDVKAF